MRSLVLRNDGSARGVYELDRDCQLVAVVPIQGTFVLSTDPELVGTEITAPSSADPDLNVIAVSSWPLYGVKIPLSKGDKLYTSVFGSACSVQLILDDIVS
jgi:hypothetical protein